MLQVARQDQRKRAQRLCEMASDDKVQYILPDGDLFTTRVEGRYRTYWVIACMGPTFHFWYGLSADSGSYRGFDAENNLLGNDYWDLVQHSPWERS